MDMNNISCCLDCIHAIDESRQCLIEKMFEKPVNPEHGCSWRVPIKRKDALTNGDRLRQVPELMTKQDAIEYLLYMKHDVKAKSLMDIALDTAIEALKQPTIEPEVRHGRWIHIKTSGVISVWKCSECDKTITANFAITNPSNHDKFCYNCGAKMDGGVDDACN